MKCYKPILIKPNGYKDYILVPCRKCFGCQEERKLENSIRYIHEISKYDNDKRDNLMILNTYAPEYCLDYQLHKEHLKAYIKRIREYIKYHYNEKLVYCASGEYGDLTSRPHYHIAMNIPKSYKLLDYIEKSWKYGMSSIKHDINFGSMFYVNGYVDKKISQRLKRRDGRNGEFHSFSRGNGKEWINKNKKDTKDKGYLQFEGRKINLPIYYREKMDYTEEEKHNRQLAQKRKYLKCREEMKKKYKISEADKILTDGTISNSQIEYIELEKLKTRKNEYETRYMRRRKRD